MRIAIRTKLGLISFIGIGIVLLGLHNERVEQTIYPIKHEDIIRDIASEYQVEPQLIAAIIRVESNFEIGRTSARGALGLMQVMPDTAIEVAHQAEVESVTMDRLLNDEELSIRIGTLYLKQLTMKFNNQLYPSLAAYNAGPSVVRTWISSASPTWDGNYSTIGKIPYAETRDYVRKVVFYYEKYKEVYPDF